MRIMLQINIILFFILFSVPSIGQDTEEIDKEMKQALEKLVDSPLPGISVAIANNNGLVWSGTAGVSNIEENKNVSQTHLFGIGRISNQFVGVVILQMAEENLVDLDATPKSILGNMVSDIDNADTATLYQLLNHTSGIYSWADDIDWARRGRGVQMNPRYRSTKEEPLKYITRQRHSAIHSPGQAYAYSSSNYTILGLIVEKISGGLIEDQVRTRILEPLKLGDTYYDTYEVTPYGQLIGSYHLATDHFISEIGINAKFDFGIDRLIDTSGASLSAEGIANGIVTTPRDLALFAIALRNGQLVKKSDLAHLSIPDQNSALNVHSEILGYTADIQWLENDELVITSFVNMGAVSTGPSETADHLNSYLEKILIPIAKKYAK